MLNADQRARTHPQRDKHPPQEHAKPAPVVQHPALDQIPEAPPHWHVYAGQPPKRKPHIKIPTALMLVEVGFHSERDAHKHKRRLQSAGKVARVLKCWRPADCGIKLKRRYADTERDDAFRSPRLDFKDV